MENGPAASAGHPCHPAEGWREEKTGIFSWIWAGRSLICICERGFISLIGESNALETRGNASSLSVQVEVQAGKGWRVGGMSRPHRKKKGKK